MVPSSYRTESVSMITDKINILRNVGYFELPKREMWVDRNGRKAFSRQALRDHDIAWLYERFQDRVPAGSFNFYFNHPEGKGIACREILAEIGLSALQSGNAARHTADCGTRQLNR